VKCCLLQSLQEPSLQTREQDSLPHRRVQLCQRCKHERAERRERKHLACSDLAPACFLSTSPLAPMTADCVAVGTGRSRRLAVFLFQRFPGEVILQSDFCKCDEVSVLAYFGTQIEAENKEQGERRGGLIFCQLEFVQVRDLNRSLSMNASSRAKPYNLS